MRDRKSAYKKGFDPVNVVSLTVWRMRVLHLDAGARCARQWQVSRLLDGLAAEGVECTLAAREDAPLYRDATGGVARRTVGLWPRLRWRAATTCHAHDARSHTLAAMVAGRAGGLARGVSRALRWKYRRARATWRFQSSSAAC